MDGLNAVLSILASIGQLVVILVLALVLFKISKFIDTLSEVIRK